jgi:DtxR family Mn-dependent transcriptional regulator
MQKKTVKSLTPALENYLRAIYIIVKKNQAARVKDVATFLNLGASSVSEALKNLAANEFINYQPYGIITLTAQGKSAAEDLCKRHEIIRNFLENVLMVSGEKELELGVKSIEHSIDKKILDKLVCFLQFMQTCACKEPKWLKSYKYFSDKNKVTKACGDCINHANVNKKMLCGGCCAGGK